MGRLEQGERRSGRHEALAASSNRRTPSASPSFLRCPENGRLGDAQGLRGARRAAEADDGLEGGELGQDAVAQIASKRRGGLGGVVIAVPHERERQRSRSWPTAPARRGLAARLDDDADDPADRDASYSHFAGRDPRDRAGTPFWQAREDPGPSTARDASIANRDASRITKIASPALRRIETASRAMASHADGPDAIPFRPARDHRHRPGARRRQRDRHRARRARLPRAAAEARHRLGRGRRHRRAQPDDGDRRLAAAGPRACSSPAACCCSGSPTGCCVPSRQRRPRTARATTFWGAMRTIVIADAVMGLDNVLAVAGAAHGSYLLVVAGLRDQRADRRLGQHPGAEGRRPLPRRRLPRRRRAGLDGGEDDRRRAADQAPGCRRRRCSGLLLYLAIPLVLGPAFVRNHRQLESRIHARLAAVHAPPAPRRATARAGRHAAVDAVLPLTAASRDEGEPPC